jgi:hypothetical protein
MSKIEVLFPFSFYTQMLTNLGKSPSCHTERRRTKREGREVAIIAVLAGGEMGGWGERVNLQRYQKAWSSLIFNCFSVSVEKRSWGLGVYSTVYSKAGCRARYREEAWV